MSLFKQYTKGDIAEARPVTELDVEMFWDNNGVLLDGSGNSIHIPRELRLKGSPNTSDYIVRDIKNPSFSWLIDNETFKASFKEVVEN